MFVYHLSEPIDSFDGPTTPVLTQPTQLAPQHRPPTSDSCPSAGGRSLSCNDIDQPPDNDRGHNPDPEQETDVTQRSLSSTRSPILRGFCYTELITLLPENLGGTSAPTSSFGSSLPLSLISRQAPYLTSRAEWDCWAAADMDESRRQMFCDSVHPVRDSGQLDLADIPEQGREVAERVRLIPAPGHIPGQVAVELRGINRSALITGDSIQHPVQLSHPHLTSCVDIDPRQAVRTRNSLLEYLVDTDALLLGTHFPQPTAGVVRSRGGRYCLLSEPGTEILPTRS